MMLGMVEIPDAYVGYAAGLTVSVLWTATSIFFTAAGRRIGATAVNAFRIAMAIVLLGVTHRVWSGVWMPEARWGQIVLLGLSGILGLSIGDQALITAFLQIGPRLAMLVMTTAPLMAALFGWLLLGETLCPIAFVGIGLTVAGVAWVIMERPRRGPEVRGGSRTRGLLLAFVGAACQAGGLLLSKQGIGHGWLPEEAYLNPQAATLVRMAFAGVGMVPIVLLHARREAKARRLGVPVAFSGAWRSGLLLATAGSIVGPYFGVWLSLVAADNAPLGIAQTLTSLTPVLILPFAWLVYRERISVRAVVGAIIAVGGIVLLFVEVS